MELPRIYLAVLQKLIWLLFLGFTANCATVSTVAFCKGTEVIVGPSSSIITACLVLLTLFSLNLILQRKFDQFFASFRNVLTLKSISLSSVDEQKVIFRAFKSTSAFSLALVICNDLRQKNILAAIHLNFNKGPYLNYVST